MITRTQQQIRRRQIKAFFEAINELRHDLPAVTWYVTDTPDAAFHLTGQIFRPDHAEEERDLQEWADYFGVPIRPYTVGSVEITATRNGVPIRIWTRRSASWDPVQALLRWRYQPDEEEPPGLQTAELPSLEVYGASDEGEGA